MSNTTRKRDSLTEQIVHRTTKTARKQAERHARRQKITLSDWMRKAEREQLERDNDK